MDADMLRIFLSYGHNSNKDLVRRIKGDRLKDDRAGAVANVHGFGAIGKTKLA
jgi:hypothetical protein